MKKISKKALSLFLALIMAVPMIMFTPLSEVIKIDADAASEASLTVTEADNVKVAVPETVYLGMSNGSIKSFQYYVNNTLDSSGKIGKEASSNNTNGYLYFYLPGYNGTVTVTLSSGTASITDETYYITVTDGLGSITDVSDLVLTTGLTSGESKTVKWTFTYDNNEKSVVAYTTVYAPCRSVGMSLEADLDCRKSYCNSGLIWYTTWISGVNSIGYVDSSKTDGTPYKITEESKDEGDEGYYDLLSEPVFGEDYVSQARTTYYGKQNGDLLESIVSPVNMNYYLHQYYKAKSEAPDNSKSCIIGNIKGTLYVDSSRYTKYSQIPNFDIGTDVHTVNAELGDDAAYFGYDLSSSYNEKAYCIRDSSNNISDIPNQYVAMANNSNISGIAGRYTAKTSSTGTKMDVAVDTSYTKLSAIAATKIRVSNYSNSKRSKNLANLDTCATVLCDIVYTNKDALREAVVAANKLTLDTMSTALSNAYTNAYYILGKPDATVSEVNSAESTLSAYTSIAGKASVAIKSTTGETVATTIEKDYSAGASISYTPGSYNGYTYNGTTLNGSGIDADGTVTYNNVATTPYAFVSTYEPIGYAASFSANGGSVSEASASFTVEDGFTLPIATKKGYTFAGWKVTSASTGSWTKDDVYDAGTEFGNVYGNVTFTAQWTVNTYYIGYDNMFFLTDVGGFDSNGVSDYANNGVSITNSGTLNEKSSFTKDFLAVEGDKEYIVSYDVEATDNADSQLYVFYFTENDDNKKCSVPHTDNVPSGGYKQIDGAYYNFDDYDNSYTPSFSSGSHICVFKTPSDCEYIKLRVDNNPKDTNESTITIKNIRIIEKTDATFEAVTTKTLQSVTYGNTFNVLTSADITRTGYDLAGWNDSEGNKVTDGTFRDDTNKVLYSQWNPKTYSITLSGALGKYSDGKDTKVLTAKYDSTDYNTLEEVNIPTRTGYTFAGYYTASGNNGTEIYDKYGKAKECDYWVKEDGNLVWKNLDGITLYAHWTANTETVNFDYKDGIASAENTYVNPVYDSDLWKSVTSYVPTKKGYTFDGYYTTADNSGIKVYDKDGNAVSSAGYWVSKNSTYIWQYDGNLITLYAHWTPITYTVNFDLGYEGGVNPDSQTGIKYDTDTAIECEDPTRTGYEFEAWYNGDDVIGGYNDTFKNLAYEQDAEVTLKAHWTPIQYTITFDANGGTGEIGNFIANYDTLYDVNDDVNDGSGFSKKGYTFDGWYYDSDCNNPVGDSFKNLSTESKTITFYAGWKAITYTIKYDANGGTGEIEDFTAEYDKEYDAAFSSGFTNAGYTFDGWYLESGCNNAVGNKFKNLSSTPGATIIFYAKWAPISYSIVFNANTGTGKPETIETTYGTVVTLPTPTTEQMSKVGYTFGGWYKEKECTTEMGASVSNLTTVNSGEVVLYAKWNPITYTIKFNANGGTGTKPADKTLAYDEAYVIPANEMTKENCEFSGWVYNDTEYKEGLEISKLSSVQDSKIELVARWISSPYKVTYVANNGTEDVYETKEAADTPFNVIENPFSYVGYTFTGWKSDVEGDTNIYTSTGDKFVYPEGYASNTPVTFTAQWKIIKYSLKLETDGGSIGNISYDYDITSNINLADSKYVATKTGYTFGGWVVTTASGNWVKDELITDLSISAGRYGNPTLTAKWIKNTYNVKYANGEGFVSDGITYNYDEVFTVAKSDYFDGTENAKTGYGFTRWFYVDDNGDTRYITAGSNIVTKLTATDEKDVILTAEWKPVQYKITFNADGGTLSGSDSLNYNIESGINLISATKKGYNFAGWKIQKDVGSWTDTTAVYAANGTVDAGQYGDVTLVAQWEEITYKVIYKSGIDGYNDVEKVYTYKETVTVLDNQFTGYKDLDFTGWKGSDESVYKAGNTASMLADTQDEEFVMTAIWKEHSYQLVKEVEAQCGVAGYAEYVCEYCGDKMTKEYPALQHKYVEEYVEPTCIEDGYRRTACVYCGDIQGEEVIIPADSTNPNYHCYVVISQDLNAACTIPSTITYQCIYCHDIKVKTEVSASHDYSSGWVIVTPPSCSEMGVKTLTCSKCNNVITELIPKTDHNITEWGTDALGNKVGYCDICQQTIVYSNGGTVVADEDGVCSLCGRTHVNFFSQIVCFFIQIKNFFASLFK